MPPMKPSLDLWLFISFSPSSQQEWKALSSFSLLLSNIYYISLLTWNLFCPLSFYAIPLSCHELAVFYGIPNKTIGGKQQFLLLKISSVNCKKITVSVTIVLMAVLLMDTLFVTVHIPPNLKLGNPIQSW